MFTPPFSHPRVCVLFNIVCVSDNLFSLTLEKGLHLWQTFTLRHKFTPLTEFPLFDRNVPFSVRLSPPCWLLLASLYLSQGSKQAELFHRKNPLCTGSRSCSENTVSKQHYTFSTVSCSMKKFVSVFFSVHDVCISECEDELSRSACSGGKFWEKLR